MTLDEAIERFTINAAYERTNGNLQGCLEFRQLAEWLTDYKRLKEQESYDDEGDVPKSLATAFQFGMAFGFVKRYYEMDCRDCKEFENCPCGKDGHESETSQGYSIGECKDFEPQERSGEE